jgi:monooxygenase
MHKETVDVVIVGAGLSGIGAAVHLGMSCPTKSYLLLEARDDMGGTWDLFQYPGIRSDSDMYTLGFSFKPWRDPKAIADGPAIKKYIRETADEYGITPRVRLRHRVASAKWSTERARWTVTVQAPEGGRFGIDCQFLFMGSGYYSYEEGYDPRFDGREKFKGEIIHPQFWPEDLDYRNKRVVVIGSGATAVTLVPEMSKQAAHVTMLQRSPTYIVARPGSDIIANALRAVLPANTAYNITRWKNILMGRLFNRIARKKPEKTARKFLKWAQKRLPEGYDMRHFTPSYNPWDQRICLAPDGDFFAAIKEGKASVETDHIERFTGNGILLKSGKTLEADIIVTATGLKMQTGADVDIQVDGKPVRFGETFSYKGVMFSDVPNFILVFGYTMASWTLKADLAAIYCCRLLNHMDEQDAGIAVPHAPADMEEEPFLDFSSGYVQRALEHLPKQGDRAPWLVHQDYLADRKVLLREPVEDGVIQFAKAEPVAPRETSVNAIAVGQ